MSQLSVRKLTMLASKTASETEPLLLAGNLSTQTNSSSRMNKDIIRLKKIAKLILSCGFRLKAPSFVDLSHVM